MKIEKCKSTSSDKLNPREMEEDARILYPNLSEFKDPGTQYQLALRYFASFQLKPDVVRAVYWLKRSARGGHIQAMYMLALLYLKGDLTPKRFKKAYVWTCKATNEGNREAQGTLLELNSKLETMSTEEIHKLLKINTQY